MKRTYPQLVGEIFDEVLKQNNLDTTFAEQRLCYLWPQVVGEHINRLTTRRYIDRGVLHVYISSAPLKNELEFMKELLVAKLNEAVGQNVITGVVLH